MKPSEFLKKHWRVKDKDGNMVQPSFRHIGQHEFQVIDKAFELNVEPYVRHYGRGSRSFQVNPIVEQAMKKETP